MKNVVTIGGGTGSYTVLSGLKLLPDISLKALVTMADDGGSTGILRDELGVLPAGDVRQCLVALSEHSDTVRALMNYRFGEGTLKGHSFGNIFLAALEKVTGDFVDGVEVASEILKVNGQVVPITENRADLCIYLKSGEEVCGENRIQNTNLQKEGIREISYKENVQLSSHAKKALLRADYIILGPGNYYCSLIPNVIVDGFKDVIKQTQAKLIFPVNLTNKLEHTASWKASNYVRDIENHLGRKLDYILMNNEPPNVEQIKKYQSEEGEDALVKDDLGEDKRVVRADLLSNNVYTRGAEDVMAATRGFIRHDSLKLANVIRHIMR